MNLIEEEWSSATGLSRRSTNTRGAISRATSRGGTPLLKASRLRRMFYAHEASRHEGLETAEARRGHSRLEALHELWSRRTDELEDLAKREGIEAVMPALRYRP